MNFMKSIVVISLITALLVGCKANEEVKSDQKTTETENYSGHKITVDEVLQATKYTYLLVSENEIESWVAISKQEVEVGETLYYTESLEMKNFESTDLKRTFETIYFVQNISDQPRSKQPTGMMTARKPVISEKDISIETVKGGITIGQLYAKSDEYSNKTVLIKGEVTKFNAEIMGKNWAHIQDGTKDNDNFDLTVTTSEIVNVGDIVTFKGKVSLDKDFGYGYSYKVLMEDAEVVKN